MTANQIAKAREKVENGVSVEWVTTQFNLLILSKPGRYGAEYAACLRNVPNITADEFLASAPFDGVRNLEKMNGPRKGLTSAFVYFIHLDGLMAFAADVLRNEDL